MTTSSTPRNFPGLSHAEFQHSLDRTAAGILSNLEKLRPAVSLLQTFSNSIMRYQHISSSVRVGPTQYPSLYKAYLNAATVLDVRRLPDLYIESKNEINAFATGVDTYMIVVNTGLLDVMNEREVAAIIAHELGHVKCDHMLYNSLTNLLIQWGGSLIDQLPIPLVSSIFDLSLKTSLLEWSRKAEFSADRAALLATQDPEAVMLALGKLAGHSRLYNEDINIDALLEQAKDFEEFTSENLLARYLRVSVMMQQSHPYTSLRVREIRNWAESDHYKRILSGKYQRMDGENPDVPKLIKGRQCARCTTINDMAYAFCQHCGTNIVSSPIVCGNCKIAVQEEYKFCPICKYDLHEMKGELPT